MPGKAFEASPGISIYYLDQIQFKVKLDIAARLPLLHDTRKSVIPVSGFSFLS